MICDKFDKNVEAKWQKCWAEGKTYDFDENDKRPVYSIDTPPPFTSGDLHMGHVLSYSYFDFVARYKRMRGFSVYYPQGWDCQGFPTEVKVEQKYGRKPPEEFRKLCVEWTESCIAKMKQQMTTMGFSPDWKYEYKTMSDDYHRRVQYSLIKMFEHNLVYNAEHPVFWCPNCNSALAKTDTDELERDTQLNFLIFKCEGKDLLIATTRPEYLHACVAVLFHPTDERYKKYEGKEITTPLGKTVKLVADKDVEKDFGTGLMMLCTFGDKQDVVGMYRHNLSPIRAMDERGKLVNAGEFDGLKAEEARKKILEKLKAEKLLVKQEPLKQVIKVHDRCKKPIELLLSRQWFAKIKDKSDEIVAAAKKMRWVPDFAIQYLIDWSKFVEWDWVISRQRVFGTPLPFWMCKKCNIAYPARYNELPVNPPTMEKRECPKCKSELEPEKSTCDCWIDSSISPLVISRWPEDTEFFKKTYPSSLRPQGVEIVRTWAFYTIYRCLMLTGVPCFKELLLNGNVLATDGKKMSKSLGNIIAPDKLIDDYSADAVRQWSALSGAMAKDRPFSYQDIAYAKSFLNKLLNASKLVEKSIEGYEPREEDRKHLRETDRWILSRVNSIVASATEKFENFEFHFLTKEVQDFFWHEFCDFYLEYVKHRIYQPEVYGEESKRAAQYTLYYALLSTAKVLAPITPHMSEEIYQLFKGKGKESAKSVHLSSWPVADSTLESKKSEEICKLLNNALALIRQHKAANKMPLNAQLKSVHIRAPISLESVLEEIKATGKVDSVKFEEGEFSVVVG